MSVLKPPVNSPAHEGRNRIDFYQIASEFGYDVERRHHDLGPENYPLHDWFLLVSKEMGGLADAISDGHGVLVKSHAIRMMTLLANLHHAVGNEGGTDG